MNSALRDRYDRIAKEWGTEAYDGTRRDDLIPHILQAASIAPHMKLLETMCGTAHLSAAIKASDSNAEITALDFSAAMLAEVRHGIKTVQATVPALPFADGAFDRVFLRSALYDLVRAEQPQALKEIRRVLAPGGAFFLQTYHTTPRLHDALNTLVNLKDELAGQRADCTDRYPRYFADYEELNMWCARAGFCAEMVTEFCGVIRYTLTRELSPLAQTAWVAYAKSLSEEVRETLQLRNENGATAFDFPGVVLKLT